MSHQRRLGLQAIAILSPVIGAVVSKTVPITSYPSPSGFWQGFVVQAFLVLAPVEIILSRNRRFSSLGLSVKGKNLRKSLFLGALYSAVYVSLLFLSYLLGIHVSHFDEARRVLGAFVVVALYFPFWGILEGVWISYLLYTVNDWLGITTSPSLSWRALLLSSILFGAFHCFIQFVDGSTPIEALTYMFIGTIGFIAGTVPKFTQNSWGLILFWVISNF